ncbi:hypothetical protein BLNAU_21049 [Blattamonas nauphoetae]|uniref:Uncharacterized protein n=1 Tax=Blattamonas nauphoetae TaxID=2049346 RepID=A0ABQ9X178_9EUKA|nr:hypothetical protein BLNAU_21049 [Blattamonas nauphoetae]
MFETISLPEIPKSDDETTHPHHPDSESSTIHDFIHSVLFITENKHFFPSFPISGESTPFDKTSPIDDLPDSKGPDSRVMYPRNSIHVDEISNDSIQNHPDSNCITVCSVFQLVRHGFGTWIEESKMPKYHQRVNKAPMH